MPLSKRAIIAIPARLASTRLPRKLLLDATGLPLICHTLLAAQAVIDKPNSPFSSIILAADSEEISTAVENFLRANPRIKAQAILTDPSLPSGSDRIAAALSHLDLDYDSVLNLQGDEPEIDPSAIVDLAGLFANSGADLATLAYPVMDSEAAANPDLVKVVTGAGGRALYFSRLPIPKFRVVGPEGQSWLGHVGIYLYRREALEKFVALPRGILETAESLEQLRALENGMTIVVQRLNNRPAKGIDSPADYADFVQRNREGKGK